ncbi:MAG: SpoIIE family protein phosphatase [Gemmatimonadota bacterium]|nr:SpoIIE family protein phosphatase [Gemmatimonadota bacterium]
MSTLGLHAATMGRAHGFDADALDRLDIVLTGMAESIVRRAGTGHIILRSIGEPLSGCIEILALDKGPGIADMTRAMRGSATPAGGVSRDVGLATIRRVADLFDIYSHRGSGTAVVAHVGAPAAHDSVSVTAELVRHGSMGAVCVPLRGEEECGDAWAVDVTPGRVAVLLVDGLGHGPEAAVAARAAMSVFRDSAIDPPEIILSTMHGALRTTRGAALSVTVIDQSRRTVRFCGVGNVDGRVVTAEVNRQMVPQNGIVGHTMPRTHADDVPWPAGGRLIMHSDGISSRWRIDHYPGLLARHPALLAGVLFRDCARPRDDATVLVLRDTLAHPD